jgi:hypothetical protein
MYYVEVCVNKSQKIFICKIILFKQPVQQLHLVLFDIDFFSFFTKVLVILLLGTTK